MTLFEGSAPEFPKVEFLMHNKNHMLTPEQCEWWDAMVRLSDILSLTMCDDIERTTGKYLSMLYTEFLKKLYKVVSKRRKCTNDFIFDDFVSIATYSVSALKHIVDRPSTHIVKVAEKVRTSQLHQTGAKTMQWMSKRPGRNIMEKIAPENKVLTNVTHFSADTKENRESLYLYSILYDIVRARINSADCLKCVYAEECGIPTKDLRDLMSLHTRIRNGELADVRAEKQSIQNNKLMCDKYYKMVWDGVGRISCIEENLNADWNHLKERYLQIGYWIVLATILNNTDSVIKDEEGTLSDNEGKLSYVKTSDALPMSNSVVIYPRQRIWEALVLEMSGCELSLYERASGNELFYLNLLSVPEQYDSVHEDIDDLAVTEQSPTIINEDAAEDIEAAVEPSYTNEPRLILDESTPENETPLSSALEGQQTVLNKETEENANKTNETMINIGDEVCFGRYTQSPTDAEFTPIQWILLDKSSDGCAVLISKNAIDRKPFNVNLKGTGWSNCSLRNWLNGEFYNNAFASDEKSNIVLVNEDAVSLITHEETEQWLIGNEYLRCRPTELAIKRGAKTDGAGFCPYWINEVNVAKNQAEIISGGGHYRFLKWPIDFVSIRPVIRVYLHALNKM